MLPAALFILMTLSPVASWAGPDATELRESTGADAPVPPADGEEIKRTIVISDVMYDPPDILGEDDDYEWVELYNCTDRNFRMDGWRLNGVELEGAIPRHSFYIVARQDRSDPDGDGEFFSVWYNPDNGYKTRCVIFDAEDQDLGLHNNHGRLALFNHSGTMVDSLTYRSEMGGAGDGPSLEKIISFLPPSEDAWRPSRKPDRFGTPGEQNTVNAVHSRFALDDDSYKPGETIRAVMTLKNRSWKTVPVTAWLVLEFWSGLLFESQPRHFRLEPGEVVDTVGKHKIPLYAPDGEYFLSLVTAVGNNSLAPETAEFSIDTQGNPVDIQTIPYPY